jgi:uncharacterized protein YcaQ
MVRRRVKKDGPVMSRDFDKPKRSGGDPWWGWAPHKAALEYLWRAGELAVSGRVSFQKVYDLTDRVFPDLSVSSVPDEADHLEWACSMALERLGVATATGLAGLLAAVSREDANAWCARAVDEGRVRAVLVESADGSAPRPAVAVRDWRRRLARVDPPRQTRLLSPFDPVIRDRARTSRFFGFDYRFEAFVPASRRQYGYYVLPVLEQDRLVGRLDAKFHRAEGRLEVKGIWWESGLRVTAARRAALDEAVDRLTVQVRRTTAAREGV